MPCRRHAAVGAIPDRVKGSLPKRAPRTHMGSVLRSSQLQRETTTMGNVTSQSTTLVVATVVAAGLLGCDGDRTSASQQAATSAPRPRGCATRDLGAAERA